MRDFMTRGGTISVDHMRELHAAADDLTTLAAEPADGGPVVSTHAGCGEGRKAAHGAPDATRDAMRARAPHYVVMDDATADAMMLAAIMAVGAVWDQAVSLATEAGPMPLVGTEAWVEGDEAYRERLCRACGWRQIGVGWDIDMLGKDIGLPRARLVLVEG